MNNKFIDLPGGKISVACGDQLIRARGIRYASASRFQLPIPVGEWHDTKDCTGPSPICPQTVPSRLDFVTGPITAGRDQDEDCLHVTVTTTVDALSGGQKLPVMAYLHGGAYVSGGADLDCYQPTGLVERGVVGVNISYRLGVFGFQPIPDIAPANLGLLDQVEALRWIKKNIAAFGGDPDNVTLFGQSAGAGSIYCLMLAEGTDGLFHKAILQSAPLEIWTPDREEMVWSLGRLAQERLATDTRPRSSQEMLSLQTELLLTATGQLPFGPLMGHGPLPDHTDVPEKLRLVSQRIPIMLGYTKDEGVPFVRMNKTLRPYANLPLIGQFIERLAAWFVSGKVFTWLTDRLHKQYLEAEGQATLYRFQWHPSHSSLRAAHCIELPFLLGSWESWKSAPMIGGEASQDAMDGLGDRLKDIWMEFANHGNDNIQGFTVTGDETKWNIVNH